MHENCDKGSSTLENSTPLEKDGQGIGNEIGGNGLPHEIGAGKQLLEIDAH